MFEKKIFSEYKKESIYLLKYTQRFKATRIIGHYNFLKAVREKPFLI